MRNYFQFSQNENTNPPNQNHAIDVISSDEEDVLVNASMLKGAVICLDSD